MDTYEYFQAVQFLKNNINTNKFFNIKVENKTKTIFMDSNQISYNDETFIFNKNGNIIEYKPSEIVEVVEVGFAEIFREDI